LIEDIIAMAGVDEATARQIAGELPNAGEKEDEELVELLPELEPVVELARSCANHLHIAGGGFSRPIVMGFDLPALDVMARWMELAIDAQMTTDLRVIEAEMIRLLNPGEGTS
jgi:hypothetical protein